MGSGGGREVWGLGSVWAVIGVSMIFMLSFGCSWLSAVGGERDF